MYEPNVQIIFIMITLSKKSKRPFIYYLSYMFLIIWSHAVFHLHFSIVSKIGVPGTSNCSQFPEVLKIPYV